MFQPSAVSILPARSCSGQWACDGQTWTRTQRISTLEMSLGGGGPGMLNCDAHSKCRRLVPGDVQCWNFFIRCTGRQFAYPAVEKEVGICRSWVGRVDLQFFCREKAALYLIM